MAELDPGVISSVINANLKNLGDAPAFYSALAMSDAVSHQRVINGLREALFSAAAKGIVELDPTDAMSQLKLLSGNDLATTLSQLGAAVAQIQQLVKGAQTTPPPTP